MKYSDYSMPRANVYSMKIEAGLSILLRYAKTEM